MAWIKDIRTDLAALDQTPRELLKFGVTMAVVFFLIFTLGLWKNWSDVVLVCLGTMTIYFLVSPWFLLRSLRIVRQAWMAMAFAIGWGVSRIILVLLFFCIVTPIARIAKISGKNFLLMGKDLNAATYWIEKKTKTAYTKLY